MTLLAHTLHGLSENYSMNQLDHWFDGFESGQETLDIYGESFNGDTTVEEMIATIEALNRMCYFEIDDIEHAHAQTIIQEWNVKVCGQDFSDGKNSVPFGW